MVECNQIGCDEEPVVQFDHCGTLVMYCPIHWQKYLMVMSAMGSPIPITYPVGTKPKFISP